MNVTTEDIRADEVRLGDTILMQKIVPIGTVSVEKVFGLQLVGDDVLLQCQGGVEFTTSQNNFVTRLVIL